MHYCWRPARHEFVRLRGANISNYKSIASASQLVIDPRITALVGKSESGKTAILRALALVGNGEPYSADDWCSWADEPAPSAVVAWLDYEVDAADLMEITDPDVHAGDVIRVTRTANGKLSAELPHFNGESNAVPAATVASLSKIRARCRSLGRNLAGLSAKTPVDFSHAGPLQERLNALATDLKPLPSIEEQAGVLPAATTSAEQLRADVQLLRKEFEPLDPSVDWGSFQRRISLIAGDLKRLSDHSTWGPSPPRGPDLSSIKPLLPRFHYVRGSDVPILPDRTAIAPVAVNPAPEPLLAP